MFTLKSFLIVMDLKNNPSNFIILAVMAATAYQAAG